MSNNPSFSNFTSSGRSNSEAISYDDTSVTTNNGSGVGDYRYVAGG